ncbi:upf3 regulator of nonsense transcripts-like protein B isoform X1 [Bombyx mori]|uniref:UPF3 domain-containing protein n=1 Tax=Bombyx mori TaxID=7091 RepID=A0A8R2HSS4_BOMMO|nr:upf3 regulator of nonsense transcripts-like protein B isoform X1 [Bombyx mori]
MTEDQDGKDSQSDSGSKTFINKSKDKKSKIHRPLTKIILRRLPPTMTEETFLEQVSPIPEHDYFYFAKPDPTLGNNLFSRAYINFVNVEDIFLFRDKFDGYVFLDEKGGEYVGIVEYAPFQRISKKKKKKDPKCGTLESDPIYQEFIESLNKDPEVESQPKLEYSYPINDVSEKKTQSTPLLEYLAARKLDKRGRDERRRRDNDKRKMRIERKTKEGPIKKHGEEDATYKSDCNNFEKKRNIQWCGQHKNYPKTKSEFEVESKSSHSSDEFININSDWDVHFPALCSKTHNTFTLVSNSLNENYLEDGACKSSGDPFLKEEDNEDTEVRKIKTRESEKEKKDSKEDQTKLDDGMVFESKSYKERKPNLKIDKKKKSENDRIEKEDEVGDDLDGQKKDKREKNKIQESPREQKSKKYSDTRKERIKQNVLITKSEKEYALSKLISLCPKSTALSNDIKPFTQLPQVKTDDLSKIIDGMDKKTKLEAKEETTRNSKDSDKVETKSNVRRNSLDSNKATSNDESDSKKTTFEERPKSSEREGSEEKEKCDGERRAERRIRNKDRPSLVIYQPGMGKFSKQRLAKEKETLPTKVSDSEKKDT